MGSATATTKKKKVLEIDLTEKKQHGCTVRRW
jgi:hypothetical protein